MELAFSNFARSSLQKRQGQPRARMRLPEKCATLAAACVFAAILPLSSGLLTSCSKSKENPELEKVACAICGSNEYEKRHEIVEGTARCDHLTIEPYAENLIERPAKWMDHRSFTYWTYKWDWWSSISYIGSGGDRLFLSLGSRYDFNQVRSELYHANIPYEIVLSGNKVALLVGQPPEAVVEFEGDPPRNPSMWNWKERPISKEEFNEMGRHPPVQRATKESAKKYRAYMRREAWDRRLWIIAPFVPFIFVFVVMPLISSISDGMFGYNDHGRGNKQRHSKTTHNNLMGKGEPPSYGG